MHPLLRFYANFVGFGMTHGLPEIGDAELARDVFGP